MPSQSYTRPGVQCNLHLNPTHQTYYYKDIHGLHWYLGKYRIEVAHRSTDQINITYIVINRIKSLHLILTIQGLGAKLL